MALQAMLMFTPMRISSSFACNHNDSHSHYRGYKISKLTSPPRAISAPTLLPNAPPSSSSSTPKPPKTTQSMPPEKMEVFKSLEGWASECVLPLVKPAEKSWQPHDLLPDSSLPVDDFNDQVRALRDRTAKLPDDYLVVLVGDMITEDALPTYQTWINQLDGGVADKTGSSTSPWAVWSRAWTAEENRHGDLLKTYLYLSGRVDMLMIEKTIHNLIAAGMTFPLSYPLDPTPQPAPSPSLLLHLHFTYSPAYPPHVHHHHHHSASVVHHHRTPSLFSPPTLHSHHCTANAPVSPPVVHPPPHSPHYTLVHPSV
ncbi:hypothetical protein PIB30_047615 [Stylosanthes scabra]|uniref:Stearoyl-[acyl-carrier-protein] 9-desaturase n=1 Tax=Stylosanthes scabra TaxID=79078 RepID=A0ABU6RH41_9FABA|nr:hypothetical protein [Stylosanthes scabra]